MGGGYVSFVESPLRVTCFRKRSAIGAVDACGDKPAKWWPPGETNRGSSSGASRVSASTPLGKCLSQRLETRVACGKRTIKQWQREAHGGGQVDT